jgi:hypothetical protein
MIHFIVAFAVLAHVVFWGAGLAACVMPWAWRRFWPVLVVPAGLALQSAVVWAGALAGLKGTNSYAWASEVLPVGLLWWASRRLSWRAAIVDVQRFAWVWGVVLVVLGALVLPLAWVSKGLTTFSLGSCDAGDYAAGARVLQEFAKDERGGFMGLKEVVSVQSVDNFFDYWTRLNHFTPSALMAFNGSILGCQPHELTSLLTMVLLAGSVPLVFWMARALLGLGGRESVGIAAIYGLSPLTWYAVGHVAPGQLLAAMAVGLITWSGVAMWRARLTWVHAARFAGWLAVGYWILLGSYNFIIVIVLVPAVAYVGGLTVWHRSWARGARWLAAMLVPLAACGVIFFGRVAGLIERFQLLRTYDFGWKIPALGPDGWLGLVSGPELEPWRNSGLNWILAGVVVLLWIAVGWRAWRQRRAKAWTALAMTGPVLAGYLFLQWRAAVFGTNASYDAYKLFSVFYPVMLPSFCGWVALRWSGQLRDKRSVVVALALVITGNLIGAGMVFSRLVTAPLIVDGELRQLRKLEARAEVSSVNLLVPDMWSRLWVNALLLKKSQYFETHTYEGRLNTPLRGAWDLNGGLIALRLPDGGSERLGAHFSIANTKHPYFLRVRLGEGWYDLEQLPRSPVRWNWTRGDATLRVENPHDRSRRVVAHFQARCEEPRELQLWLNGRLMRSVQLTENLNVVRVPEITVPPGASVLELRLSPARARPGPSAGRPLGLALYGLEIEVKRDTDDPEP